ncbi:uncharacterized protein B0J16DRAFT_318451 [Fusarium flagelliforme]|uniref:uncharacterized protein n=1 Tax=Fusarium flagelliforme TaxID=2675880 RepID=UPI001E8ED00E|nr:uncharacterized protein B0J16DRAFT_318451 [Fusarium flagelliforme]KAH7188803.1 hypothetical protein B0J16DRAFT_318451 [Fusarium flagelliforme]
MQLMWTFGQLWSLSVVRACGLREGAKKNRECKGDYVEGGGEEGTNKDTINIQASLKKYKKKEDFSTGPGEVDERGARLWGMGHETGGEGGGGGVEMCDVRRGELERRALEDGLIWNLG